MRLGEARARSRRLADWAPYAFVVLPLGYLGLFMSSPLASRVQMSLTGAQLVNPSGGAFVGLDSYRKLLGDPRFCRTLRVTIVYTLHSVFFGIALGSVAAVAIDRPDAGSRGAVVRLGGAQRDGGTDLAVDPERSLGVPNESPKR